MIKPNLNRQKPFVIIESRWQEDFEQQVSRHLQEGYQMHGVTRFVPLDGIHPILYLQAMVLGKEPE